MLLFPSLGHSCSSPPRSDQHPTPAEHKHRQKHTAGCSRTAADRLCMPFRSDQGRLQCHSQRLADPSLRLHEDIRPQECRYTRCARWTSATRVIPPMTPLIPILVSLETNSMSASSLADTCELDEPKLLLGQGRCPRDPGYGPSTNPANPIDIPHSITSALPRASCR